MKRNARPVYCADFETTVYEGQDHTEVWSAALVKLGEEEVHVFGNIVDFLEYLISLPGSLVCYFHNLKFDGHFIVYHLLKNNWVFNRDEEKNMRNHEFKCSISGKGQWYTLTLKVQKKIIEFRDSLKLLPFSLERIGKAFKTKHQKLEMEYKGLRYANCPISESELEYIKNDVLVLKEALELMSSEGHTKLTIGSCCMSEYKAGMDKEDYRIYFPKSEGNRSG